MKIIVDANPIISMLIKPGKPIDLFLVDELELVSSELLFQEVSRNKDEIIRKSRLSEDEVDKFIAIIKKNVKIIPEKYFIKHRSKAEEICPHEKDIVYFALALYLRCPLWTNEKRLKEQNEIEVYSTHELMKNLGL